MVHLQHPLGAGGGAQQWPEQVGTFLSRCLADARDARPQRRSLGCSPKHCALWVAENDA